MKLFLLLALAPVTAFAAARPNENNLDRSFAAARKDQVRSVAYELHFQFEKGKEEFQGQEKITLELTDAKKSLSLDWLGKPPTFLSVNGQTIKDFKAQTGSFEIPARVLSPKTQIEIHYTAEFSKEGEGIQHVTDPEDKEEYIYTDFEPFQAHQLFPCFDQPDLKAHFSLTISAPSSWKALGNELPSETRTEGEITVTKFRTTPLLSTYLFFVGAGPFTEWTDEEGKTPLFLYARKSMAKYLDAENLFATTKKGLRFYSTYFGFEYPFSKFAMIFVPEFGWGGMENPGAITMNERMLFRGPVPQSRRDGRDGTILHEMAHMWFGDLVTLSWWNDLWLNESFATYMATIAQDRALGSPTAWQDFASSKTWGYWQDQLVTTHPIETDVKDVRFARGNFDGITYAKGAAALQQLHFFVGEDAFREGVQAYFRKHAFGNAERRDFVGAIAEAGKLDLKPWTHSWLQTSGPNKVSASWGCSASATAPTLVALSIRQEKSSSGSLAPHRTRLGLFRKENGELRLYQNSDVAYDGTKTEVTFDHSLPCPDFVYPNLDDKDYALFSIDAESLKKVGYILGGGSPDPLLRLQIWNTLSQMVREGKLGPLEYMNFALEGLAKESDSGVLASLLGRYSPVKELYNSYLSRNDRSELAGALEKVIWSRVAGATAASGLQMAFFDFYTRLVQTKEGMEAVKTMLVKNAPPEGIQLDQERRWNILFTLARNGHPEAATLISEEEKRDPSDSGKRSAYATRVALPGLEGKREFWKALDAPEKIPPTTLRLAAGEFHQPNYLELSEPFVKDFFQRVKKVNWKKSDQLVEIYFGSLFPQNICSKVLLSRSVSELKNAKNLTQLAKRSWLEANDELARCVRVGRR